MKFDKILELYPKEYLIELYIIKQLSIENIAKELDICTSSVKKLLTIYDIRRDNQKIISDKNHSYKQKQFDDLLKTIPRDVLYQKYIIDNATHLEIQKMFNLSDWTLNKILNYYDIHKEKKISVHIGLATKYQKAGSKKAYAENVVSKQRETLTKKYGSMDNYFKERDQKIKQTYLKHFNTTNIAALPIIAKKKSISLHNIKASNGEYLDSSWELSVYEFAIRNHLDIERNIPISFMYNGKKHNTLIDFRIDGILFEVKGSHLLSGCFDSKSTIPIEEKLKLYKEHNVVIITDYRELFGKPNSAESNGLKYQNKCPNPLIGVDIKLFNNPDFPYDPNKPKCYYDVKVNNNLSSFDAFNDEAIRWKMIKNRIEYSGGFIDNKQILNALNVTRTCKQPSWFSKTFAKYIINKYATSDVIVDPFAGWGARYDASIELGKNYIGCDLNRELVDWHNKMNRDIQYADANTFNYDKPCSVFICPPYQDIEKYFDDQDSITTQCEWLAKVMHNVPHATEYIMVCKIVDPGYEQYVVEVKENKSHFGTNKEYILLIKNNN